MRPMKSFLTGLMFLVSSLTYAEDGIVYQFKISQLNNENETVSSYTNAVLMKFNESVSFDLADAYRLSFDTNSRSEKLGVTNVVVTLEIIENGRPYYIGAHPKTFVVGEEFTLVYERYDLQYEVKVQTSFGEIPDGGV